MSSGFPHEGAGLERALGSGLFIDSPIAAKGKRISPVQRSLSWDFISDSLLVQFFISEGGSRTCTFPGEWMKRCLAGCECVILELGAWGRSPTSPWFQVRAGRAAGSGPQPHTGPSHHLGAPGLCCESFTFDSEPSPGDNGPVKMLLFYPESSPGVDPGSFVRNWQVPLCCLCR